MAYAIDHLMFVLAIIGIALVLTLALELPVAALFRVGWWGIAAVALVNLVTNPPLSLIVIAQAGVAPAWAASLALPILEVAVVIIEWRLLAWALHGTAGSSRRMLTLSITMNAASVAGGYLVLLGLGAVRSLT
jgi:hypothetical protein